MTRNIISRNTRPKRVLVAQGRLQIRRRAEIGAEHYGAGDIPYRRTTALGNWEVSQEVYEQYRRRQCLQVGDILLVNDGDFRIGRTVMLTRRDLQSVVQSHCRILRDRPGTTGSPLSVPPAERPTRQKAVRRQDLRPGHHRHSGNWLLEVALPFSRDQQERKGITAEVAAIIADRTRIRERVRSLLDSSP